MDAKDGMLMYWHAFNALDKKDKTLTPRRREQTLHLLFSGGGGFFFSCLAPLLPSWLGARLRSLVGQGSPQSQGPEAGLSGANSIPHREPTGHRRVT